VKPLPIDDVLPEVIDHLRSTNRVVICAPPGAGKTTRVPGAILDAGIGDGRVVMLEPRRVAARSAARRIAYERGVRLGAEVGYRVRFDDKTSKATRIELVTEGLLTRRLQSDPTLEGVGVVILDEFHERSIHADLAIAFLQEIQETVRDDLRVVVMSATLDADRVSAYLGGCPVVRSQGRLHPVERRWSPISSDRPLPERVAATARKAMREADDGGDLLVFLPGAGEIRRTADALEDVDADVHLLYGDLDAKRQDAALEPGPRQKIVLATNIAETSLTIEGVTTVVDSGLVKQPRHDPSRGIDRLDTVRISRASAEQRAGRAGRLAPGRVYRMWSEAEERSLVDHDVAEICRVDLASTLLDVIAWSGADPATFSWFEAPPAAMITRAARLLRLLGAVEDDRLTALGQQLRRLPLHPRIGAVLIAAHQLGVTDGGAAICALASERDILRRGPAHDALAEDGPSDILWRLDRFKELERRGFRGGPPELDLRSARAVGKARDQLLRLARGLGDAGAKTAGDDHALQRALLAGFAGGVATSCDEDHALQRALLAGFADRVAKRRGEGSDRIRIVGGRGGRLDRSSVVRSAELMVAVELDDTPRGAATTVRLASSI